MRIIPCLLLAALMAAAEKTPALGKVTMVWDGDTATQGTGWAKAGGDKPASIQSKAMDGAVGTNAIVLHCEGDHWVRAGWRWTAQDSHVGFNAKPFSHFRFQIRGLAVTQMPKDITVQLVSTDAGGTRQEGAPVSLGTVAPKALGGGKQWVEVVLPVADLVGSTKLDPTSVQEVMLVANGDGLDADLMIDGIGFAKAKGR